MKMIMDNLRNTARIGSGAVLLLLFNLSATIAQQTFQYNQYMDNLTPFNPAWSLLDDAGSVNALVHSQWAGIEGAPSTLLLNGSLPLRKIRAAAGVILVHDEIGAENQTELNAFIAKAIKLSESSFLSTSVSAGFRSYKADYSQLDASDPEFRDNISETVGTIGLGVMMYNPDKYYIGISLPRMSIRSLGKSSAEDKRYQKNIWYFSGGYLYSLGTDFKIKPAVLLAYTPNMDMLTNVSATLYVKDRLGAGLNYQSNKEMAGILSYLFSNSVRIGYSYQFGFGSGNLGSISNGTHEVTLGLRFGQGLLPKLL